MPQNEYIEQHRKRFGVKQDFFEVKRKKEARLAKERARHAQELRGRRAIAFHKERYREKVEMKKTIKEHEQKNVKTTADDAAVPKNAVPVFLMDRKRTDTNKVLSNTVKQKKKEKAGKWNVPIPKVKPMAEDEMFKVMTSGKRRKKAWKRMITKASFVGENFTRKAPKYERFIRPMALRYKNAHVTHPDLKATFYLPIIGVKKNPQSKMYTSLGVITKGSILEVNVSDLGLVTPSGKVVWGKYAQVTNNPENDGCINAVLLV
eukprot:NODE_2311_length_1151_cov_106.954628_g1918_i0.p1 GENE.NODE_2311_length_1151_cov_106.954628_g1918_i0~~NODE_2311_length_1151_cov_106.954628_g1918_i0.p1  ORF type:complete len:262 (+),score=79.03 NODE_2311_length_1151_cov_106.954628_g1918_i0:341-1126(+)